MSFSLEPGGSISGRVIAADGVPDLDHEEVDCLPIPQIAAETINGPEQSKTPLAGHGEQLKDDSESQMDQDDHVTEADRLVLSSYDQRLGGGVISELEGPQVELRANRTIDLVRQEMGSTSQSSSGLVHRPN
jgi:hypothetical protein